MPLPSDERLTQHFTAYELGADRPEAAPYIITNLTSVAQYLEVVRTILGDGRIQVNTPDNSNRGFAPRDTTPTSSHPLGLAADIVPLDFAGSKLDLFFTLRNARDDGRLPPFDQIIFYPFSRHTHIGLGGRMRGEFRVHLSESTGGTPLATIDNLGTLVRSGSTSWLMLALLVALGVIAIVLFA